MVRRATRVLVAAGVILARTASAQLPVANVKELRVTFLCTSGGPVAAPYLAGSAALVEFGPEAILIDAGRGVTQQMQRLGRSPGEVTRVFITHLHSDHTVGLPELWLARWTRARFKPPLEVVGPAGTASMASHIQAAWQYDVDIRSGPPENMPRNAASIVGRDVTDGVVFNENGLKVTAVTADHGPVLNLGYRIDAGGHSIAFSGDDIASEKLIVAAQGVDVMVHNEAGFSQQDLADSGRGGEVRRAALKMLATPEQAGTVFARTHPKLAVLVHFNRGPEVARTRSTYSGPLEESDDLMQLVIGDSIMVIKPPLPRPQVLPAPAPANPPRPPL
jgi:ribonuclease Z